MKCKAIVVFLALSIFLSISVSSAFGEAGSKPIELKVTSFNPAQLPVSRFAEEWGKRVEEQSGGKVKLTFYWAGTLASYRDTFRVTQSGVADIGMWLTSLISGAQPLHEFINLPFIGWDSIFTATRTYHELRGKFPELDAEFRGMQCLYATAIPPTQLHMTHKTVVAPEDIKGIKLLGGGNLNEIITLIGGVPVDKPPPDWFMSLQKGLVEGHFVHWAAADGFKLTELFSSHTELGGAGISTTVMGWWMNEKTWNTIAPEARQAFMDLKDWAEQETLKIDSRMVALAREKAIKMGHEVIDLTPEQLRAWTEKTAPIREKWIADTEKKGLPAKAVYAEAQRLICLYNQN